MKSRSIKILGLGLIALSISLIVFASRSESDEMRRELLVQVISFAVENGHYNPGEMDDEFSEKAFNLYIERLDFSKRFLLQKDIDQLKKYKHEIDDAIKDVDFTFFDESVAILNTRTQEAEKYYADLLENPFDFDKQEWYELDGEKTEFAKSTKELKERWRLSLKYETMVRLYNMLEDQQKAAEKSDTVTIKSFETLEIEAREKIKKRYEDWFHRMSKLDETDRLNTYVNSIVNVFDPHTSYFPPRDKENFDIRFSGQLEGIGAQLTQKNAYVEVTRIIPGSPSWKQGELEVGDFILKVAQEGEQPVDIVDMRLDEAVQLIRGKKGTKVTLSIKKLDGDIKDITLTRDVVILEETYAKSAIFFDDKGDKYGYIKLPSFYVDFTKINGKNCFDDMKVEIEKLKEENIDGLVFDIRDNGGGSLEDVVKIAGLFIDKGPVVQVKGQRGFKRTYKDQDAGVMYDGPLVVMVNAISASASEIFAAAMQDYKRALIVGGESTYGKGTVQNFTELDRMVPKKPADMQELGALKMTVQKFYRINGGATQLHGVTPDIVFPDYYNYMDFGEADLDYAMPWSEITPLEWESVSTGYDMDYIVDLSEARITSDTVLSLVAENGKRLQSVRDFSNFPLDFDDYKSLMEQRETEGERYERIGKDTLGLQFRVPQADVSKIESDTSRKARSDAWIKSLKKDVYLYETINIMKDINDYMKSNADKRN